MPLPSYTYSGAVYSSPAVGTVYFNLTTSGGAAIGFLDPSHIRVFTTLDGGATLVERFRPAQWEFNTALTQVKLSVATVANEAVIVRRITPITGPLVDVPDGINLPAQRLRDVNLYNLYVTQEQYEANAAALALATDANTQVGLVLANVANQLPYTLYANRAAVPTNPGSAISGEVLDSTSMQTFTPLTGVPSGFVGSSSLIVRIRYSVSLATWQWIDYRAANADSRYLLKTQLVNSAVSSSTVDPPTAAAVKVAYDKAGTAQTGVDTLTAQVGAIQSSIASQYTIVGNVASIPAGTNGLRVDITNSTGIESFTPLTGRPSGFVGSTSLSVRLVYSALANTWQWVDYRAVDPDGRYAGVNFTQSGTGAVARTVKDKLMEVVSVKDFGAVGDGAADDTAAIQAALTCAAAKSNGCKVLADGFFKVTATLVVTGEGVCLGGSSRGSCRLLRTANYGSTIRFGGVASRLGWLGLENAYLDNIGTMNTGSHVVFDNCYSIILSNCIIKNGYNGVSLLGVNEGYVRDVAISANTGSPTGRSAMEIGLSTVDASYGGDIFMDGLNFWCGTATLTTITPYLDYGFKVVAVDGLWLNNVHVIATKVANYSFGNTAAKQTSNIFASQAMSDISAGNGIEFIGTTAVTDFKWSGRVSALGQGGTSGRGISITSPCTSVTFECSIDGFNSDGIYIDNAQAQNIDFISPQIQANDYDNGGTAGSGINIVNGYAITVSGGYIKGYSTQDWGVVVGAGASRLVIDGLRVEDNINGGIQLTSGASNITITNCDLRNNTNAGGVTISNPGNISNLYVDGCPGLTPLYGSVVWDPPAIGTGTSAFTFLTIVGAAVGDAVIVSATTDLLGLSLYGYVSAVNTVTLVLANVGGGSTNLPSMTVRVRVEKYF